MRAQLGPRSRDVPPNAMREGDRRYFNAAAGAKSDEEALSVRLFRRSPQTTARPREFPAAVEQAGTRQRFIKASDPNSSGCV